MHSAFSKADQSNHKKSSLASEKNYATQVVGQNCDSAGRGEIRLVDNIIIENGEEGVNYEITAGLVTESHDIKTIIDTVYCSDLKVGQTYKAIGILLFTDTGDYVTDADGNIITAEKTFTAEATSATVDIEFEVDTSKYAGKTIGVVDHIIKA